MSLLRPVSAAALALMLAAPAPAQPSALVVQVYSYGFAPKPIQLAAGRPVRLTFVNQSGSSHDFTARSFFAYSRILAGDAAEGEIELPPHSTRTVTLVPRAGTYHAHGSHFFHAPLGMTDTIIVR
jgi:plastocyanin